MTYKQRRRGVFQKIGAVLTALILVVTVLYPGNSNTAKGAASASATAETTGFLFMIRPYFLIHHPIHILLMDPIWHRQSQET